MAGFAIYCRHIIVKAAPAAITGPFQSAGAAPIKAFTRKMGRKKMKERKISPKNLRTCLSGSTKRSRLAGRGKKTTQTKKETEEKTRIKQFRGGVAVRHRFCVCVCVKKVV